MLCEGCYYVNKFVHVLHYVIMLQFNLGFIIVKLDSDLFIVDQVNF